MAGGVNTRAKPADRCVMRPRFFEHDHLLASHYNQEPIARLHAQGFTSLSGNDNLVFEESVA
jgi:hypothetical protein